VYAAKRLFQVVPTIVGAVTLIFVILRLAPGDPVLVLVGQANETSGQAVAKMLREYYGLDRPLYEQYLRYVGRVFVGDFGTSIHSSAPVLGTILSQLFPTVLLAFAAVAAAVLVGVPLGILAAIHRNRWIDYLVTSAAVVGISAPPFWVGILLVYWLGYRVPIFPLFGGGGGSPATTVHYLVLPALAVGTRSLALVARMTRSALLEVLRQDYVRTARAKGVREADVLRRHAIRNAAMPILSIIGLDFAYLLGGAVTIEMVFSRPGIGRLLIDAIFQRDYPLVQGCVILFALGIVFVNLLTDLTYLIADPRVSYG
jgi:ABC-type dipeptide/oligopeptide/nickel transport system permease component